MSIEKKIEKIEKALEQEKKAAFLEHALPRESKMFRDSVLNFIGRLSSDEMDKIAHEQPLLKDIMHFSLAGNNAIYPMEILVENGKLKEVSLTMTPSFDVEFARPRYKISKNDGVVTITQTSGMIEDVESVSGDKVNQLFDCLSENMDTHMEHATRAYDSSILLGLKPVDKLERFLEDVKKNPNSEVNESKIDFISRSIDCHKKIIEEYSKSYIDPRRILMDFNNAVAEMYWSAGDIKADGLMNLYKWSPDGAMKHPGHTKYIIDRVIEQHERSISADELKKYRDMSLVVELMNIRSENLRDEFFKNKDKVSIDAISHVNHIFGMKKLTEENFVSKRYTKYRDWMFLSEEAVVMDRLINQNKGITPLEIVKNISSGKCDVIGGNGEVGYCIDRKITSRREMIQLLELIDDAELRHETMRIARRTCDIAKTIMNDGYSVAGLSVLMNAMSEADREIQKEIFENLKNDEPRSVNEFHYVFSTYLKGNEFSSLIKDGDLPAVAAKKAGITRDDVHYLKSTIPILGKVRFEPRERDLDR
jgi:hypothetical protein